MGKFLNLFSFPSNISDCSSSSFPETLSNSSCHSQTNLHFCFNSFSNLQEKVWVFSLSLHISCFELCFLDFVIRYWVLWLLWFRLWAGFIFIKFGCLGFVDIVSRLLNMVTFMFLFSISVYYLIYDVWYFSYPCLLVTLSYDIVFVLYSVWEYFLFHFD